MRGSHARRHENMTQCEMCGSESEYPAHVGENEERMTVCETCYNDTFGRCVECDTVDDRERMTEVHGDVYCRRCAKRRIADERRHGDDGAANALMTAWAAMGHTRAVSAEIECYPQGSIMAIERAHPFLQHFTVVRDGSVPGGKELKSCPVPISRMKSFWGLWSKSQSNFTVDRSCGLHIHVNLKPWIEVRTATLEEIGDAMKRLWIGFWRLESYLFNTQPRSRQGNSFAVKYSSGMRYIQGGLDQVMRTAETDIPGLYYGGCRVRSNGDLPIGRHGPYNGSRYYFANIHALMYLNTLEIRLHAGTVDGKKIANWSMAMEKLVAWIMEAPMEEVCALTVDKAREIWGPTLAAYMDSRANRYGRDGSRDETD